MAFGSIPAIATFENQIATILGYGKNWNLQESSYNGAQFHWMQKSYSSINPMASLQSYVEASAGSTQKPNYGTWANIMSISDSISRKVAVYPIPNFNGYYAEDFGAAGIPVDVVGIIYGPDYLEVLQRCMYLFNDTETYPGSGVGIASGSQFRLFTHPVFGQTVTLPQVFFMSMKVVTSSDHWQAAAFKLSLLVTNPNYLIQQPTEISSNSQIQNYLNLSQDVIASITQTYSIAQTLANFQNATSTAVFLSTVSDTVDLPMFGGSGEYILTLENTINTKLSNLVDIYTSSTAFLVQNSDGLIQNSFWQSQAIDYSLLPVYIIEGQTFSYSDAQSIISNYADNINDFIDYAETNGYETFLQNNINALRSSMVYLDQIAKIFLQENAQNKTVTISKQIDLYSLMFANDSSFSNFEAINDLNRGVWFSCLKIPAGTTVTLI